MRMKVLDTRLELERSWRGSPEIAELLYGPRYVRGVKYHPRLRVVGGS
jgi:hypothetical protein